MQEQVISEKDHEKLRWSILPPEIKTIVFSFLGAKDLGFFSQTSKENAADVLFTLQKIKEKIASEIAFATAKGSIFCYTPQVLYACGYNYLNQLGVGDSQNRAKFTKVPLEGIGQIKQVYPQSNHTLLLTDTGLYASGANNGFGTLGLGDTQDYSKFTKIPIEEDMGHIKQVAVGVEHTILLTDKGLYGCGGNGYGQLANKEVKFSFTFMPLPVKKDIGEIKQVYAGGRSTWLLTDKGLFACGNNCGPNFGQLGLGMQTKISEFTQIPLDEDIGHIKQVIVGESHAFLLTSQGLYGTGQNYHGKFGIKDMLYGTFTKIPFDENISQIKKVISGAYHTLLLTDEELYGAGRCWNGQLGLGDQSKEDVRAFIRIPIEENIGRIEQVHAGGDHTLLFTDRGLFFSGFKYGNREDEFERIYNFTQMEIPAEIKIYHQLVSYINYLEEFLNKTNEAEDTQEVVTKYL